MKVRHKGSNKISGGWAAEVRPGPPAGPQARLHEDSGSPPHVEDIWSEIVCLFALCGSLKRKFSGICT